MARSCEEASAKKVSLLHAISLIVGSIIGSGIFISPKGVLVHSGSVGYALIMWLVAGLISTVGALCFAELGTTYPHCGGSYKYLKEMFGPLFSFVTLWATVVVTEPAGSAVMLRAFASNLLFAFYDRDVCKPSPYVVRLIAAWCLCLITFINCHNKHLVLKIQTALAFTKVLALVSIICLGIWTIAADSLGNFENAFAGEITAKGTAFALYSALFAYGGWTTANDITGQLRNPHRNLPLAIIISLPLVISVYVLVNMAYFTVLPYDAIMASGAVAVTFGKHYADFLAWIIPICIAVSIYGSLNGKIYTGAVVLQTSAMEGQFPYFGAMVHTKRRTLVPVLIFQCALTLFYINFETSYLINMFSFVSWFSETACIAGIIYYRFKKPEMQRTFANPIIVPMLYICVCIFLIVVPAVTEPVITVAGIGMVILGIPSYYIVNKGIELACLKRLSTKVNEIVICLLELAHDDTD